MAMKNANTINAEVMENVDGTTTADATNTTTPAELKDAAIIVSNKEQVDFITSSAVVYGIRVDIEPAFDDNGNPAFRVILRDASNYALERIERKCNIKRWSDNITGAANNVSHFVSDTADFALNGGVVPVVTSVYGAGVKIASVGTKAAVRTAASVLNVTATEAMKAGLELYNDKTLSDTVQTVKTVGKLIGSKLFGSSGSTQFQRC